MRKTSLLWGNTLEGVSKFGLPREPNRRYSGSSLTQRPLCRGRDDPDYLILLMMPPPDRGPRRLSQSPPSLIFALIIGADQTVPLLR